MNIRKYVSIIILPLITYPFSILAQNAGIYLTHNQFDNAIISYGEIKNLKYRFNADRILNQSSIKIVIGDSIYYFNKDSIFGFRDNKSISYRFYGGEEYQIMNPTETILLYKLTNTINGKGFQTVEHYFFSCNSNTTILPLTKLNLKIAFPNRSNFHELIDMYFDSDRELLSYDSFYHIYKINRVYQLN
ncbi:MAG: hypothetical protein K9I36_16925 [Bacteroidia bacterium]|nr:hypothetical protein [Bacteroidia bacterium]